MNVEIITIMSKRSELDHDTLCYHDITFLVEFFSQFDWLVANSVVLISNTKKNKIGNMKFLKLVIKSIIKTEIFK